MRTTQDFSKIFFHPPQCFLVYLYMEEEEEEKGNSTFFTI